MSSFNKRKDKYWFEKTSRKYSDEEVLNFLPGDIDEEGGTVVIDQITDEALADVDAGEKEVTDKQLTEKYGTTDPVEIQKIIKGETPSRLTTDNIIIDNIETDGVDQTMDKVVDGTLADDSFINLLDNADISSYGDLDYTELADMIKNKKMRDYIATAYKSAALDVPTFLPFFLFTSLLTLTPLAAFIIIPPAYFLYRSIRCCLDGSLARKAGNLDMSPLYPIDRAIRSFASGLKSTCTAIYFIPCSILYLIYLLLCVVHQQLTSCHLSSLYE